MTTYDVIIVGSGFGGAVAAARLGEFSKPMKRRVLVLERGRDHTGSFDPASAGGPLNAQGNRFRQSLAPAYSAEIARVFTDKEGVFKRGASSLDVAIGQGIGGGSNAYDGVSLRAPSVAFDQLRDGERLWPAAYSRASLDPYYERVEQKLRVAQVAWTSANAPHWKLATKRDWVFAEGCRRIGAASAPLKLADANDANEGWWNQGQRFEGRQSLTKNYLLDAKNAGVEFLSGHEVTRIERTKTGWAVSGTDSRTGAPIDVSFECKLLVIASGAVASSALLLSARDTLAPLADNDHLGARLSGNGDYGVTGIIGKDFERPVEGFKGKPMSSFCPTFWNEHRFILIPFYAAPLYLALGKPATLLRASSTRFRRGDVAPAENERPYGAAFKERLLSFGSRMLTMGCLALDDCEGEVAVTKRGTEVRWRETSAATHARWSAAFDVMRRIYESLGGEIFLDAYRKDGTVSTAHPLGGCRMATNASRGVVSEVGEVFGLENLFVIDGAIIPSALGVNPSLTIAAVAERICDALIAGQGTPSLSARLA